MTDKARHSGGAGGPLEGGGDPHQTKATLKKGWGESTSGEYPRVWSSIQLGRGKRTFSEKAFLRKNSVKIYDQYFGSRTGGLG